MTTGYGYGYGKAFEADPALLSSFITQARELGKDVRGMARDFVAATEPTSSWYGVDDDFAREAGPQARKDVQYVVDALGAIGDAFTGIVEGHLQELHGIRGAQGQAMDDIALLKGQTGAMGDKGSGKH
ncbi:hypothetical protein [Streptomyces griseoaurantiacus]|uniref:hypothetical protein n=1 Tax=Streptomyces griseoaurantiacus TaxID=68213 RepID=UPI0036827752